MLWGIGEQKFRLPADSLEMRRVYDVARDFNVPVLLHFGGEYNTGLERFHKVLEAYLRSTSLGMPRVGGPISARLVLLGDILMAR